jgi:DNA-binding GntR family transcriptional regulator
MKRKITEQVAAQLDVSFHDGIYRAAHHERLYRSWSGIRMQVHWLLLRTVASQDWREGMVQSHSRILELIKVGDEAKAVSAVGEHISHGYHRICGALVGQQPDQDTVPGVWQRAESYLFR